MKANNYPKADRYDKNKKVYVRYPVKRDGQYFGAEVLKSGYQIPLTAEPFPSEQKCKQACDACNRYNQYTEKQCIKIISDSMRQPLEAVTI